MKYKLFENQNIKLLRSENYNYNFSKITGYFQRWGKTQQDDPQYSPFGPEILDLEISINGCPNNCSYCYKNNSNVSPTNMDFATFKTIINKIPKPITQCALGITGIQTNPDFLRMMKYSREKGIIPNFTLSGIDLTNGLAKEIAKVSGALAVSAYESDKNVCYNTVKKFTDLGMKQVNIHLVVSSETLLFVEEVLHDVIHDPRLTNLNAVIFLGLKPKGRAKNQHPASVVDYNSLIQLCQTLGINYGFDSCSAPKFEHAVHAMDELTNKEKSNLIMHSESCESGLFSAYINVEGQFFPCSFTENEKEWETGLDVVGAKNFLNDVWNHERVMCWRNNLLKHNRQCPTFPQIN